MTEAQKIVEYAISQIGTAEDPLGSNKQKYGALIDSTDWYLYKEGDRTWRHLVNGYDWCTQFVDASFITNFGIDRARKMLYRPVYNNYGAVVKYAFNYFKNAGQGFTKEQYNPQPGDVIYFQNSKGLSHTGIVVAVTASQVTTVEGNSGTNCYYVAKHTYSKTSSYIYGYGCPDYDQPAPDPKELDGYKVGDTYMVICNDDLNVRTKAEVSDSSKIVTKLKTDTEVVCKALTHDDEGNTWMRIDSPAAGWICCIYHGEKYVDKHAPGWEKKDGKWYYYDSNGKMVKSAWQLYKGSWYYLGADGVMYTGWKTISNAKYYFYPGDDGHMASAEYVGGLAIDASGKQTYAKKASWESTSKGKRYKDETGWYPKNRSLIIDRVEYEFDKNGYVITK